MGWGGSGGVRRGRPRIEVLIMQSPDLSYPPLEEAGGQTADRLLIRLFAVS